MKTYTLKDYIDILAKENLIDEIVVKDLNLSTPISQIAHNSKNVTENTLYICKGIKYKP